MRDAPSADAAERGQPAPDRPAAVLAASIVGRVVRGIPADLAWRWNVRPAGSGVRAPLVVRSAVATAVVLAVLELGLGFLALGRVVVGLGRGEPLPSETTVGSAIAGTLVLVAGLALVARQRTRVVGLLALGLGAAVTVHFATLALVTLSSILADGYVRIVVIGPSGFVWWVLVVGALAAFPAVVAISEPVPARRGKS